MFDVSKNAVERIKEISLKEKHEYFRISVDGGGVKGFPINLILIKRLMMKIKFLSLTMLKF